MIQAMSLSMYFSYDGLFQSISQTAPKHPFVQGGRLRRLLLLTLALGTKGLEVINGQR